MKQSRHGQAAAGTESVALRILHSETQCRLQHKIFEEVEWPGARPSAAPAVGGSISA